MGLLFKFVDDQLWTLYSKDAQVFIDGQYILPSVTHDKSVRLSSISGLGRENPIVAFLSGEVEKISFQALIMSTHYWDDVEDRVRDLFKLVTPLEDTGVLPRCSFWHGNGPVGANLDGFPCLVKSIGGIEYSEPKYDGNLKRVTFNIELWRFEDTAYDLTSASGAERETKYLYARTGDYFEIIAAREYGNALLGVNLRKIHSFPNLEPGDPVKILRRTHSKIFTPIKPEEFLLQEITTNKDLSREIFASRNRTKNSFVI